MAQKYDADTIPICVRCDSASKTKTCKKCGIEYCAHYASTTDVRYCANCLGDMQVRYSIIEKTIETLRPDGEVSFSRKYQAMSIKLQGTDWLFNAALIEHMSDEDLDATIEYHDANKHLMMLERESRRQERIQKLANVKVVIDPNRKSQFDRDRDSNKKEKKTRTKTKDLSADALLKALQSSGLSAADIMAALGGK